MGATYLAPADGQSYDVVDMEYADAAALAAVLESVLHYHRLRQRAGGRR